MSFAAPFWLAIAGLVAAGVVVAHLITRSQPRRDVLPTVRFVPQTAPLAVTRTRRPTDIPLLLTRLAAVVLFGLALAGMHVTNRAPARVVIADLSRSVGDTAAVRDSVRALGDATVIAFGDTAGPRTLSAALVAAYRAIADRDDRDATELVVVSPLVREQVDSATAPLLALWEGTVRVARVAPASPSQAREAPVVIAEGDDPVASAIAFAADARVRVFRSASPGATDSAWARDSSGVVVNWPAESGSLTPRNPTDAQQGIAAGAHVVIGNFQRTQVPRAGRAVVWWLDGEPAATESTLGTGCIRDVAIPVDRVGDVALRASFRGVVAALTSPCGGARDVSPIELASVLPSGAATQSPEPVSRGGRLSIWLALAALLALALEQILRRRAAE